MEIGWIVLLIAVCMMMFLFAALFFIQKKNVKEARKQLKFIYEHPDMNLRIRLAAPSKSMEQFFAAINLQLELFQKSQIMYDKHETKLKQEIANISHDLRTPLTSILGYMSILTDETLPESERKEYLSIVRKKGEVMKAIVESFYELSTLESKDYVVNREEIYLYAVVCDILLAFYQDFERKNIDVQLELSENITILMLDKHLVIRIVNNLIQNALRYAKSWTKISLKQEEEAVILSFSNDTEVLESSDLDKIFERTYTGDEARTYGQMGLGLSIAKKLVELQDGTITANVENNVFEIQMRWER